MGQLKASEIERYLEKPDSRTFMWLVYGPDRGLVSERAGVLAKHTSVPLDDPFAFVKLDASSGEKGDLQSEANTVGMFSGKRLIWVASAGNDRNLVDSVKGLLENPPVETLIILEAGDLKKGAALRSAIESGKGSMAIPCYQDNNQSINRLIDDTLQNAGLSIDLEARHALMAHLGGDRGATRQELDKLVLFAHGGKTVTMSDVQAVTGDASAENADLVVDAVLTGNIAAFDGHFSRFMHGGGDGNMLFFAALRQFQMLEILRANMDEAGQTASAAVASAKPPVFFARKPVIEAALRKWTGPALRAANQRLRNGLLAIRQNSALGDETARMCLLGLAVQSARRR